MIIVGHFNDYSFETPKLTFEQVARKELGPKVFSRDLARVSRASFDRSFREQRPVEEEMEVRSAIQQIAVEHRRRYGYRRISPELRRRAYG